MSRFAYTYEDPDYEVSEELMDQLEQEPTQEVEDEVYSPYYGA